MPNDQYLWTSLYSFLVDIKNTTVPYADYKAAEAQLEAGEDAVGTYEYNGKQRPLYQLSTLEAWWDTQANKDI